jgi:hypothetical protein
MVVVSAPIGGFANHTTWLLWIHPEFKSHILKKSFTQEEYNNVRGVDWPDIDKLDNITDPDVKKDIENFRYIDVYPKDHVQYILDNIYTQDRTWHNWLPTEWQYRKSIYNFEIEHTAEMHYAVLCTIDVNVAYKNYLKVNSSLATRGLEFFRKEVADFNASAIKSKNLVVDNTVLFSPELDIDYYKQVTEYFKLEDRYQQAQVIHDAWYRAQMRSETEFLKEVNRVYG